MLKFLSNSILKVTLRLKILWTWIKIRANSFIKTCKQHETKINEGASNIITREKKCDPALQRTLHQNRCSLVVIRFFFSNKPSF